MSTEDASNNSSNNNSNLVLTTAFVDGDAVPLRMTAEQVRSFFPLGVRGLKVAGTNQTVFPGEDGSLSFDAGRHYQLAPSAGSPTGQFGSSNNNNNNNNFPRPSGITSSPAVQNHFFGGGGGGGRGSAQTLLNNQNQHQQQQSNVNRRRTGSEISTGRNRQACAEHSDEEIGVIISPQRSFVGGVAVGGSQNQNDNNNEEGIQFSQYSNVSPQNSQHQHQHQQEMMSGGGMTGAGGGGSTGLRLTTGMSQAVIKRGKLIMDRVHDHIMIPPLLCRMIDSPEFQRLRSLKQLGSTSYLYPGATHTRFEHSIGVSHLAGLMAKKLARRQPDLMITDMDILCLMVAGLSHDLGHGPFSHLFEVVVNASLKQKGLKRQWHHEEMSVSMMRRIFKHLREENDETVRDITDEDINFIEVMIEGLKPGAVWDPVKYGRDDTKRCLLDIVANKRNGIDVDKLDYFLRDSLACYGKAAVDIHIDRLINSCRAIRFEGEMQICFEEKMALSLGDIFSVRAKLHKYAYQHKTTKVVDNMIKDALEAAEPFFFIRGKDGRMVNFQEAIDDTDAFCSLGDWILNAIAATNDPNLQKARDIIHKLHTRQLYPLVGGAQLRSNDRQSNATDIQQGVLDYVSGDIRKDVERALIVEIVKITYGSSDSSGIPDDPVNHVTFYNPKGDCDRAFRLNNDRRNPLFSPMAYAEKTIMCFMRDPTHREEAMKAFESWRKSNERYLESGIPTFNSPAPNRRNRENNMQNFTSMMTQFTNNNNSNNNNNNAATSAAAGGGGGGVGNQPGGTAGSSMTASAAPSQAGTSVGANIQAPPPPLYPQ